MKSNGRKILEKITVDRKIVEGLRSGKSLNSLKRESTKGKGYVIKIKDLALEYGFIEPICEGSKIYRGTAKVLPPYPETLFPIKDGRSEKFSETDNLLNPQREWIKERFLLGWSPQTVFEEISVAVPRASFYRYIQRHQLMPRESIRNVMEIIHAPGECLQVDWGKLFDYVDKRGKKRVVWFFLGTMGHSRYQMAQIVESGDFKTTIEALQAMFTELGGLPRKVMSDNPKVFVLEASRHEPRINPGFERFADHYGFTIEALPPRDPKKKGKVERMVPFIRRLFESYDFGHYTLESAQAHINAKLKIANERKHGTHQKRPIDVFIEEEAPLLKPLPQLKYEVETILSATVRADGFVRFLNKYYRVDQKLKGEQALVIGNQSQVFIYCKGLLLEVYERITDAYQSKACKEHYKESWEKTLQDHGHYLTKARQIGKNAGQFVSYVLAKGNGFVDTRVIWGLLSLDKKYSREDLDRACLKAIELNQINLRTVRALLSLLAKQKPSVEDERSTTGGKFARPMSVYKNHLRLVRST